MLTKVASTEMVKEVRRIKAHGFINAVAWSPSGARIAALSNFGSSVSIWDAATGAQAEHFDRYAGSYAQNSFAYLPDGTLLTAAPPGASPDGRDIKLKAYALIQWNPDTGQPIRYIPESPPGQPPNLTGAANRFAVSQDGSLIAGVIGESVLVFETASWSVLRTFPTPPTPDHRDIPVVASISPNRRLVAIGTISGYVHVYELGDTSLVRSFVAFSYGPRGVGSRVGAISFSPDGRFLVAGRGFVTIHEVDDGWTRIWSCTDWAPVAKLTGGEGSARSIAWKPDGTALAVGSDGNVRIWSTTRLPGPPELLTRVPLRSYSAAYSSAGLLASSDSDDVVIYQ
jgi:WD40 repeat protein